jgi:four helix bundle protein
VRYDEWEASVPEAMRDDALWSMRVYRAALYAAELGSRDAERLRKDRAFSDVSDQLRRSAGSIGVNIAEGYSRLSRRDRSRFYEYALGSARESREWYYRAREPLVPGIANGRIALHPAISHILLVMLRKSHETPAAPGDQGLVPPHAV